MSDRIDKLEEKHEKLWEKHCRLEGRVRDVENKEAEHGASITHIIDLLNNLPIQFRDRMDRLEERMTEPLARQEKAKVGVVVGIIGIIVGMILNGG